jgi:hypothetical protein
MKAISRPVRPKQWLESDHPTQGAAEPALPGRQRRPLGG